MYESEQFKWNSDTLEQFTEYILKNTLYLPGIMKGNGVFISTDSIATCAHVIFNEDRKQYFPIRCFINGKGEFGIVKFQKSAIFEK